jgi:hypothetical protein
VAKKEPRGPNIDHQNIDQYSVFGEYKAGENRLTVALLQILKRGGEPLVRYFAGEVGFTLPSSDIGIFTQVKTPHSVLDGLLESNFTFRLLIESKIEPGAVRVDQQDAHLKHLAELPEDSVLLYLTPDAERPKALPAGVAWANWIDVRDTLKEYREKAEIEEAEVLSFLIDQFELFASNLGVLESWGPRVLQSPDAQERVLIVPARNARGVARKHLVYVCQDGRSFKPSRWIAFYAFGQIDTLAEVDGVPEDGVVLTQRPDLAALAKTENDPETPRRLIRLKNVEDIGPIRNDHVDKSGNKTAWVMGQRYTTIDRLRTARITSEL